MPEVEQSPVTVIGAGDEVLIRVKVKPGARRNRVVGVLAGMLKVEVSAPPEQGKANAALSELIAKRLGVPKKCVEVIKGKTSREKTVLVKGVGLEAEEVMRKLL